MQLWDIYSHDIPSFIKEISEASAMQRLKDVGMNCGCEYTSFPLFQGLQDASRFDHSVGVALIVWHFTKDAKQSVAGLLHDISSPTFAHVIDFLHGDYLTQESTESDTEKIIADSHDIQKCLCELGLETADVADYHLYPIADNDTPRLSADRLEYTLGNTVNYKFASREKVKELYNNLIVGTNEEGQPEIMFTDKDKAIEFAHLALRCSKIYICDEDRYAMQRLSEILKDCISRKIINEKDLYLTETEVISKLCATEFGQHEWEKYCNYNSVSRTADLPESRIIHAKKRHINPLVKGLGRVTDLSEEYKEALNEFLSQNHDYAVCGFSTK